MPRQSWPVIRSCSDKEPQWQSGKRVLHVELRKLHTALMLMEMLVQLHGVGLQLAPSHVKRNFNAWTDELTNPNFSGLNKALEICVESVLPHFNLLNVVLYGPQPLGLAPHPRTRAGCRMGRWRHPCWSSGLASIVGRQLQSFHFLIWTDGPGTYWCPWP